MDAARVLVEPETASIVLVEPDQDSRLLVEPDMSSRVLVEPDKASTTRCWCMDGDKVTQHGCLVAKQGSTMACARQACMSLA